MSSFALTKNQYLLKRLEGMKRSHIAREQGISQPALYPWLTKWEIRGSVAEEQAIEKLKWNLEHEKTTREEILAETSEPRENAPLTKGSPARIRTVETANVGQNSITFTLPIGNATMPTEMPSHMDRHQAFQFGLQVLQAAIAKTHSDIIDLLEEDGDTMELLRKYVAKQIEIFTRK